MAAKIIAIENIPGRHQFMLDNILPMVPDTDREDKNLLRLLAFRLQNDGQSATVEFLMRAMREKIRSGFEGNLYAFLMTGARDSQGDRLPVATDPPDIA